MLSKLFLRPAGTIVGFAHFDWQTGVMPSPTPCPSAPKAGPSRTGFFFVAISVTLFGRGWELVWREALGCAGAPAMHDLPEQPSSRPRTKAERPLRRLLSLALQALQRQPRSRLTPRERASLAAAWACLEDDKDRDRRPGTARR
jgi:hypothetical protein